MIFNLGLQDKNSKSAVLKYRLYLQKMDYVDVEGFPKAVEATISANVLKPGINYIHLDAAQGTIKPNTEPGQAPMDQKLTVTASIEGLSKKSLSWFYELNGERVILIWERCTDGQRFIAGSPCSGGLLLSGNITTLENGLMGITLTFTGGECPEPLWFYDGPLPLEAPTLVPADATTFALSDKVQYQLSDNTGAKTLTDITNVTDSDVGRIIELIGAGTNNPTKIASSSKFLLRNGLDFTAVPESRITFLIVKAGAGTSFLELHRA